MPHDRRELFREIAPAYETPFDRSRPLWEARLYDGLADGASALFFKLHHAVADGVGGNAIFAAMTDWEREPQRGAGRPDARADRRGRGRAPARRPAARWMRSVTVSSSTSSVPGHSAQVVADTAMHPSRVPQALAVLRSLTEALRSTATRRSSNAARSAGRDGSPAWTCRSRRCAASVTRCRAR